MGDGWGALQCCGRLCVYVFVLEKSFVFGKGEEEGSKQNNVIEKEFCKKNCL